MEAVACFRELNNWSYGDIYHAIEEIRKQLDIKFFTIAKPIRLAVTGKTTSPPIADVLEIIGKTKVINRMEKIINFFKNKRN